MIKIKKAKSFQLNFKLDSDISKKDSRKHLRQKSSKLISNSKPYFELSKSISNYNWN